MAHSNTIHLLSLFSMILYLGWALYKPSLHSCWLLAFWLINLIWLSGLAGVSVSVKMRLIWWSRRENCKRSEILVLLNWRLKIWILLNWEWCCRLRVPTLKSSTMRTQKWGNLALCPCTSSTIGSRWLSSFLQENSSSMWCTSSSRFKVYYNRQYSTLSTCSM